MAVLIDWLLFVVSACDGQMEGIDVKLIATKLAKSV